MKPYLVDAEWDDEASVWVATSDDIPGLVTEAETKDDLIRRLRELVPELLELNSELLVRSEPGSEFTIRWTENQRVMYA